ncbi:hypothetical protein BVG16_31550 [Paenibacillus selenitireducens]|uniref:Uncharacterized protein n=1 Tax=Paenibacillus selenitireducens TaxID=1324314 RepID=A0A1T2WZ54_9BACL|nr:hypothetical protein [Paenibacillus selenitireducens]OPA72909.1 hypothetical protein BVG16_31550 [Paenibacillus selenitireducens]
MLIIGYGIVALVVIIILIIVNVRHANRSSRQGSSTTDTVPKTEPVTETVTETELHVDSPLTDESVTSVSQDIPVEREAVAPTAANDASFRQSLRQLKQTTVKTDNRQPINFGKMSDADYRKAMKTLRNASKKE